MEVDSNNNKEEIGNEKVKIYINVEPFGLKFGAIFKKNETFQSPVNFILNQFRKANIKFELGRITEDKTGALILADNLLGDFLENNDTITLYSQEYGFVKTNIPGGSDHNSIRKLFFLKNVSDLYKSKNFLKKKRNLKNTKKNNEKKEEKKEEKKDEKREEEEENEEKSVELNKEKENLKNPNIENKMNKSGKKEKQNENKKDNKNENDKSGKKQKTEKKEQKNEEKKNVKKNVKSTEKKQSKKKEVLSSESESEEEKEKEKEE